MNTTVKVSELTDEIFNLYLVQFLQDAERRGIDIKTTGAEKLEAELVKAREMVERLIEAGNWLDNEIDCTGFYQEPCRTQRDWRALVEKCKEAKNE